MRGKCIVILSGGQDSTICLFWAKEKFVEVHALTFDYGQRHSKEIEAAMVVARRADVSSHEIIKLGPILAGKSPLTNPDEKLEEYDDYETMDKIIGDRVEVTFVPMRNALFLTVAANRAICKGIYTIVGGMCQMDRTNYPDCRPEFIWAQENMIHHALGLDLGLDGDNCTGFDILVPLMDLSKAESIDLATFIPGAYEALAWTHTSYDNQYPPTGHDHATVLRARGFEEAGLPDPLIMRALSEGLISVLPETNNYSQEAIDKHNELTRKDRVIEVGRKR